MTRPLDPDTLVYSLEKASDPRVSPSGDRIVYTLTAVDKKTRQPRSEIWMCRIDGSAQRRFLDLPARGARWSPDGSYLAFTGPESAGSAILLAPADDPVNVRELTRHEYGIGDLAWSPDGHRLAYTSLFDPEDPDETATRSGTPVVRVIRRLDYKEDGRGFVGDRRRQVFVVEVAGGARRRVTGQLVDHSSPQWSPDSRRLAVHVTRGDRGASELALVDLESGELHAVSPPGGRLETWAWSPTGDRVIYSVDPDHTFHPDYFVYELEGGATRRLTEDVKSVPEPQPVHPVWLDDDHVLVHTILGGSSALEVVDADTGATELVQHWESRHSGLSIDRGHRFAVQSHGAPGAVGELSVYDRSSGATAIVTAYSAPVLSARPAASFERFQVRQGELTIDAWLLTPPDFDPRRRYPVILDVHGGPTANYGYGFMEHQQCLATHGFLVVYANPRGSSSYGRDFAGRIVRDWGGEDYRDVIAALDVVLERPYADRDRTGIFGISYGGYMTAWAISQTNRFRAAVCGSPIFDLESDYGTSDVAFNGLERHAGGPPHAEREWYTQHSPSSFAHRTRTPTLIFHGEADERCPIGQSEQMFVALKKAGCETEFLRYPGASHMFFATGRPEQRADWLARVLAWFKKHLGEPSRSGVRPT